MIYDINGYSLTADYIQIFDHITGIGDSLMAGYSATSDITISSAVARERGANWLAYMGLSIGRTPNNLAVGNTTTHDWRYTSADADLSAANITTNCYLVGLGVNDSRHNLSVGTSADIKSSKSSNADSFYGNMDYIVRTLHEYNANAHIFLFTIPGNETKRDAINTAIRYIANLYSYVHCIDLASNYEDEFTSGFIADNYYSGHYNAITYKHIACLIESAINKYMFENYTKFKNVPYQL